MWLEMRERLSERHGRHEYIAGGYECKKNHFWQHEWASDVSAGITWESMALTGWEYINKHQQTIVATSLEY